MAARQDLQDEKNSYRRWQKSAINVLKPELEGDHYLFGSRGENWHQSTELPTAFEACEPCGCH